MDAIHVCGDADIGIFYTFSCECAAGSWSCTGAYVGGGADLVCPPANADAGDAGDAD
jgi:hypothetical protein